MAKDFILAYAKMIVKHPDSISVETIALDNSSDEIRIFADQEDVGKLIGKGGHMINSIKTVVSGCKAKYGKSYKINVKAID